MTPDTPEADPTPGPPPHDGHPRPEPEAAPDGVHCKNHPERAAHLTCPQCRRHYCVFCFQMPVGLCEGCLQADPARAVPPLPFETPRGGVLATMATALSPARTAPAFATDDVGVAVRFWLLTGLPLAALAGIIPLTQTLAFMDFGVKLIGTPDDTAIALDVLRAAAMGMAVHALHLGALSLPFASLMGAYGGRWARPAALRTLLYRGYLLPVSALVLVLAGLGLGPKDIPLDPDDIEAFKPPPYYFAAGLLQLLALVLVLLSMGFAARMAAGLKPLWTMVVVIVSSTVGFVALMVILDLLQAVWPTVTPPPGT